jgi:hypothetical protein
MFNNVFVKIFNEKSEQLEYRALFKFLALKNGWNYAGDLNPPTG